MDRKKSAFFMLLFIEDEQPSGRMYAFLFFIACISILWNFDRVHWQFATSFYRKVRSLYIDRKGYVCHQTVALLLIRASASGWYGIYCIYEFIESMARKIFVRRK